MKAKEIFLVSILLLSEYLQAADYNIVDFGAVRGKLSTASIQKAIDTCFVAGGGRVIVPAGSFITGTLLLKSNVNLYLEYGAELLGSENLQDYKILNENHGIIYCEDAVNVSISGAGTINGNGTIFYESGKNDTMNSIKTEPGKRKITCRPEFFLPTAR